MKKKPDLLAQIRRRPSYHLVCLHLENLANPDGSPRLADERIAVDWFGSTLGDLLNTTFRGDTLLVALADAGYTVTNTCRGLRTDMHEGVVLDMRLQVFDRRAADSKGMPPHPLGKYGDGGPVPTPAGAQAGKK